MFNFKPNLFNNEIGIDIGTVNTVLYLKSKGVVVNEPSVVAVRNIGRKGQKEIIAFGMDAKGADGAAPGTAGYVPPAIRVVHVTAPARRQEDDDAGE